MKKFCFFISLFMVSCSDLSFDKKRVDVLEFKYKGHSYLRFNSPYDAYDGNAVVHDPNCNCFNW